MLELHRYPFAAMGTACTVYLYATDRVAGESIALSAISEMRRIEERYSRYRPDSYLSRINREAMRGGSIAVDDETAGLLDYAYSCYEQSDGLFDITSGILRQAWNFSSTCLPDQKIIERLLSLTGLSKVRWETPRLTFMQPGMELDFGGLGKEYAADRAAAVCASLGIEHGLVDLGGDIRVIGPHSNGEPWRIDVRHPRQPDSFIASITLDGGALASSGDYERCIDIDGTRYGHILSPKTGWPARGLCSVTVAADQCLVAGSISTIGMLRGAAGIAWLHGLGVAHLWMDEQGRRGGDLPCSLAA